MAEPKKNKKPAGRGGDRKEAPPPDPSGRVLPHDLDLERDTLSACFRHKLVILQVRPFLKIEHFFGEQEQIIYEGMLAVAAANEPVDMNTVRSKLRATGMLERAGGATYLADLTKNRPEIQNVVSYAERLVKLHKLREMIGLGHRIVAFGHDAENRIDAFAEETQRELSSIVYSGREDRAQLQHVAKSVDTSVSGVQQRFERGSPIGGVATGFRTLDEWTCGLMEGDVWYIAARPGIGKTSALLGIVNNIIAPLPEDTAIDVPEYGVAVFSLEMPREQIAGRLICMEGNSEKRHRIPFERWRSGQLRDEDWEPAYVAAARLKKSTLWIDDTPNISLEEAEAKLVALKADWDREPTFAPCPECRTRPLIYQPEIAHWFCPACHPDPRVAGVPMFKSREQLTRERRVAAAVFDYLGLMKGDPNARSREEEIGGISRGFKTLAKRRKVGVIAAAQLNRAIEQRAAKERRPQLSDLRESGSLEQDADLIMFLNRMSAYRPNDEKVRGKAEWDVAKQRNGRTGRIDMRYEDSCSRFSEEDDLPPGL